MTEERFKAWYHGALMVAALAEVFLATTRLRKGLLLAAAGWHASCVAQHIADESKIQTKKPYSGQSYSKIIVDECKGLKFPDRPLIPKKTVVFDQERCTAWEETRGGNKTGILRDQPGVTTHELYDPSVGDLFGFPVSGDYSSEFKPRGCI